MSHKKLKTISYEQLFPTCKCVFKVSNKDPNSTNQHARYV